MQKGEQDVDVLNRIISRACHSMYHYHSYVELYIEEIKMTDKKDKDFIVIDLNINNLLFHNLDWEAKPYEDILRDYDYHHFVISRKLTLYSKNGMIITIQNMSPELFNIIRNQILKKCDLRRGKKDSDDE